MKKKDKKYLIVIVLLLLFTVSIGYAVISKNYNFKGLINIKGNKWDLKTPTTDEIVEEPTDPNHPVVVEVDPETGDITISYNASLEKPGDTYSLVVPITNNGTIDATIAELTTTPLTAEQQKYLKYTITAEDGSALKGKDLAAEGGVVKVKIVLKYDDTDSKNIPEDDITGIELKTVLQLAQKQ